MELKDAFIKAVLEVCALYSLQGDFKHINEENLLATNEVNVMISFAQNPKGKVIFGFSRNRALKIASAMLGREVESLDTAAKNVIGEFVTFITSLAIGKTAVIGAMYFSAPVIVTGTNVFLMISRQKSNQLVFQIHDDETLLTYCIE
jgi:CheY-specific phosphatase CheX